MPLYNAHLNKNFGVKSFMTRAGYIHRMILASLSIFPTSEGSSVSKYVKEVLTTLDESGLHHETNAMATVIEAPDLPTLFSVITQLHETLLKMQVSRIHIDLHIDHRVDKQATIHSKLSSIGKR